MSARHCMIVGCKEKHYSRGLCEKHYGNARRNGTLDNYLPGKTITVGCKIEGCREKHWALGYCHNHYRRIRNSGDPSHHRRLDGSMKIWKRKRRKRK